MVGTSSCRVLPIVNVSIFVNMAPLYTVLLAIPILGEKLTLFNGLQALFSFMGVVLIILGRGGHTHEHHDTAKVYIFWALLVSTPLVSAIGEFQSSKISRAKVNPFFLTFWSNMIMALIYGPIGMLQPQFLPLNLSTILLFLMWAACTIGAQGCKMVAFSHDKVTRVYPIYYFESVYCLFLDVLVFDETFNMYQIGGIFLVFSMFFAKLFAAWREKD